MCRRRRGCGGTSSSQSGRAVVIGRRCHSKRVRSSSYRPGGSRPACPPAGCVDVQARLSRATTTSTSAGTSARSPAASCYRRLRRVFMRLLCILLVGFIFQPIVTGMVGEHDPAQAESTATLTCVQNALGGTAAFAAVSSLYMKGERKPAQSTGPAPIAATREISVVWRGSESPPRPP
jgi:hypothetical protein